jgi:L-fuconolactonase
LDRSNNVYGRSETNPITADRMVGMMDAVGVGCGLLASSLIYGTDHSYAFAAAKQFPGRFGVVGPVTPDMPDLDECIARFRDTPAAVGVRVVVNPDREFLETEGARRIFALAEKAEVPTFVWVVTTRLHALADIASSFPNLLLVIDHLGMRGAPDPADRLAKLPNLLALAKFDNVAVKCSGAAILSTQPYPFADLWPHLHQVIDAFGAERVMWGSDITQHMHHHTYAEAVDYMRRTDEISESEKELIMGQTARRLLRLPSRPEEETK